MEEQENPNQQPQQSFDFKVLFAGAILVILGFALGWVSSPSSTGAGTSIGGQVEPMNQIDEKEIHEAFSIQSEDSFFGNRNAPTIVVEYSDFECPFCKKIHPDIKSIVEESDGDVVWVYRHLPFHKNARITSILSECVFTNLGNEAFWLFTDTVFENQTQISREYVIAVGEQLGLTTEQITACENANSLENKKIDKHIATAQAFNFNGTPGGVIYNQKTRAIAGIPGAVPKEQLLTIINQIQ